MTATRSGPSRAATIEEIRRSLAVLSELESSARADGDEGLPDIGPALHRLLESQRRLELVAATMREAQRRYADARSAWMSEVDAFEAMMDGVRSRTDSGATATSRPRAAIPIVSPHLPPLSVSAFGRFEVRRGGEIVPLCPSRSGQTILRYLTTHPRRRESMDSLMDLLWPGDPPKTARHKLHCAFSALRGSLNAGLADPGPGYVRYGDGAYQLAPEASISVDLDAFFAAFAAGQRAEGPAAIPFFERACELATGELLPDDGYADWALERRDAVTAALMTMSHALARHHATARRWDEAAAWYGRMLAQNRCDETAHRGLMRVYHAAGRRGEALRQYRDCTTALAEDLGVDPMPETTAVYESILNGDERAAPGDRA
jgi:DNA-binding SARP family transcriptional activator